MIIECINCGKKFDVNSELIPSEGRTIQCGSCNHIWFFKKKDSSSIDFSRPQLNEKSTIISSGNLKNKKKLIKEKKNETKLKEKIDKDFTTKGSEIIEYKSKSNFTFTRFLSYIVVFIISFISFIILVDTFKLQLYNFYPDLEFLLYSFYETLIDIQLFIKDLN